MHRTVAVAAIALLVAPASGRSQQDTGRATALNQWVEQMQARDTAASFAPTLPTRSSLEALAQVDSATANRYLAALQSQYDYKVAGFAHRSQVFKWQLYSTIVIFAVVVMLVLVGLYFSWLQFRRDLGTAGEAPAETHLSVSTEGVKVQSSVLGVIILVISLLFFYLYLVYVYPIQEIL